MKRPQNMTMRELIDLPVFADQDQLPCRTGSGETGYGGAFRDENGRVWGTLRLSTGWVRYPAYLALMGGGQRPARSSAR